MKDVAIKAAKWMLGRYAPKVQNMTREEYMAWRKSVKAAPDPRDYEDPAEFEHEREKWVMKIEAKADEGR
jgi:hypothetical protein